MKKTLAILLAALFVLALFAGCGGGSTTPSSGSSGGSSSGSSSGSSGSSGGSDSKADDYAMSAPDTAAAVSFDIEDDGELPF